jgi:hypothetical protein
MLHMIDNINVVRKYLIVEALKDQLIENTKNDPKISRIVKQAK